MIEWKKVVLLLLALLWFVLVIVIGALGAKELREKKAQEKVEEREAVVRVQIVNEPPVEEYVTYARAHELIDSQLKLSAGIYEGHFHTNFSDYATVTGTTRVCLITNDTGKFIWYVPADFPVEQVKEMFSEIYSVEYVDLSVYVRPRMNLTGGGSQI